MLHHVFSYLSPIETDSERKKKKYSGRLRSSHIRRKDTEIGAKDAEFEAAPVSLSKYQACLQNLTPQLWSVKCTSVSDKDNDLEVDLMSLDLSSKK